MFTPGRPRFFMHSSDPNSIRSSSNYAVVRCNVGGKLITNYMKEQISYRFFNMTEETWLVSHIREQACHVSLDFLKELRDIQ